MKLIEQLEKRFGHLAITNLTYYLIGGQVLAYLLAAFYPQYGSIFALNGNLILQGQWWRIVTFLFTPISSDPLFAVFTWYLYYLYGTALEKLWGSFRYLVYLGIVYLITVILAFVFPYAFLGNLYIYTSVFLAFAYLFPDYQFLIFFILPVKAKWLGVLAWIGIFSSILFGAISTRVIILLSLTNFLLFFGEDIKTKLQLKLHHTTKQRNKPLHQRKAYHVCAMCGRNEVDNPDMQILYCNDCHPETCYCELHINSHKHKVVN